MWGFGVGVGVGVGVGGDGEVWGWGWGLGVGRCGPEADVRNESAGMGPGAIFPFRLAER